MFSINLSLTPKDILPKNIEEMMIKNFDVSDPVDRNNFERSHPLYHIRYKNEEPSQMITR